MISRAEQRAHALHPARVAHSAIGGAPDIPGDPGRDHATQSHRRPRARALRSPQSRAFAARSLGAQSTPPKPPPHDSTAKIDTVKITVERDPAPPVAAMQQLTLPVSSTVTAKSIEQTVNVVDPEDAVKYLPSVFLRKRNYGDTQAVMGTRVWGVSSSVRSLIFRRRRPASALIETTTTSAALDGASVSPPEISRIDMMYGPYSAAYAGNSMGAVMEITTRQPDSLEASIEQTEALQRFSLYGTTSTFATEQTNLTLGDRFGKFSVLAQRQLPGQSQPTADVRHEPDDPSGHERAGSCNRTSSAPWPTTTRASGLLHTGMSNAKLKLAYDITSWLRASYSYGHWQNNGTSTVDSYLDNGSAQTFAGEAGFATGTNNIIERPPSAALCCAPNTQGRLGLRGGRVALYRFDKDQARTPTVAAANDTTCCPAGTVAVLDGTGWSSTDLKAAWHAGGPGARNTITFGVHQDGYRLFNPTYNTADWRGGAYSSVATEGDGNTQTTALWAQESWLLTPELRLNLGGRWESWRAFDGFNANGATTVNQPSEGAMRFSPKGSLAWDISPGWRVTASVGKAYRFATAAELYQLVSTGATFTSPDPDLKPDNDLSSELKVQRTFSRGMIQLALFQDDVHDAIISQFLPLTPGSSTLFSYLANVDHVQ